MSATTATTTTQRRIETILRDNHQTANLFANTDDEDNTTAYVVELLSDRDSYSDIEGLVETLTGFLGGGDHDHDGGTNADATTDVTALVQQLQQTVLMDDDATSFPKDENRERNPRPQTLGSKTKPTENPPNHATPRAGDPASINNETDATNTLVVDNTKSTKKKSKRQERLEKRKAAKGKKTASKNPTTDENKDETTMIEDDATAWKDRQNTGQVWGGRGYGGRGEYAGAVNHVKSNIHLSNVTVSLPTGMDIIQSSVMDIQRGHRYGLIGRNGIGKSTLLHRLAKKQIPGMPHDMRILLVQQQVEASDVKTALEVLMEADTDRLYLLQEQERLEKDLETCDTLDTSEIEPMAERLNDIAGALQAMRAETAELRALEILKGLQFSLDMIHGATANLSGGWRMRLALARALFVPSDLLLFDECTNHLDLHGLDWLIRYLQHDSDRTLIAVSHDQLFLDAVCTDIVRIHNQQLSYHVGNFSEYQRQQDERATRDAHILDSAERQRAKAEAFVQKQQAMANKKKADPNKQRQAKMIREKKLDRLGNYREDGKRYKLFSLKEMSETGHALPQKVQIQAEDPVLRLTFPDPTWPAGIAPKDPIMRAEDFAFGYNVVDDAGKLLLKNLTLSVQRGSKIAMVGKNGSGKSTLVKLLAGDLDPSKHSSHGTLWRHSNVRVGHVTQYSVEELEAYASMTVVEYADTKLRHCRASETIMNKAGGSGKNTIRQYLGAFGLGGRHALQPIGKLSGGERMRLCFATVLGEEPHLLCLDESTNHVDMETLESMSQALNSYQGSILMVSHNQSFLSGFCNELWVVDERTGHVSVQYSDTESFDEMFSAYRNTAAPRDYHSNRRQQTVALAKKATQQRQGTRQNTGLL